MRRSSEAPSGTGDSRHSGQGRLRTRLSVRSRVLFSVLAMSLLGLVVTEGIAFVVQFRALDDDVTEALEQEVAEFRTLAREGIDPETGAAFASVERLLRVTMQRNVPDRNETYLTLLDGVPLQFDREDRPIELESEPAVLDAVAEVQPGDDVALRDVATSAGAARLAIVPVGVEGDEEAAGAYVIAFAMDRQRDDLMTVTRIYIIASLLSLLLVGIVGWQVTGRLLRPLTTLREATQRINETDLTERIPVRGNDDVTDLTRTYNAMLDRLQAAMDTQRQFLDDAGHELRTPLTIVRGHLELLDSADPRDVAETRALLLDEIDRMSRMVDDLILLSKAQRPDFVIVEPIDLVPFTLDVAEKVQTLGERRWSVTAQTDARFVGDAQRLTQALVQLAHNAVKFSEPGSAITIGSEASQDEVRLWVADEGIGIEGDDLRHIFDRFGRAASGRGIEGSGLGLSIVAAIAHAHGGRVDVTTTPGRGSTFTVVLPVESIDQDRDDGAPSDLVLPGMPAEEPTVVTTTGPRS